MSDSYVRAAVPCACRTALATMSDSYERAVVSACSTCAFVGCDPAAATVSACSTCAFVGCADDAARAGPAATSPAKESTAAAARRLVRVEVFMTVPSGGDLAVQGLPPPSADAVPPGSGNRP